MEFGGEESEEEFEHCRCIISKQEGTNDEQKK